MSEVQSSTTGIWAGPVHLGSQSGDEFGHSIALNFESTRLAVGAPGNNSDTGYVYVADYDEEANTWTQVGSNITGPHTSSRFGHSIDMNWTGDRIIVGANTASNVYIYDYSNGWTLNHVINTSITSFGHCVSLANDVSNRLCVGAPDVNTVYVYEERNGTWNLDFSNVGTDFENVTPLSYGGGANLTDRSRWTYSNLSYINVYSTYTQYGYSVQMSAFGEHIIVGAPGTRLLQIDSTNSDATQVYQSNTYVQDPPPTFTNNKGNYQSGHARIFKCPNEGDWTSGVTQVGQLLRGDPDGNRLDYWDSYRTSLPGFGFNSHISYDGNTILVTSVEQGVRSESVDFNPSAGRVSYYTYNTLENTWEHQQNITGSQATLTGWGSALSYDGVRIGHTELNRSLFTKLYDWNGLAFYDVSLPISGISGYNYLQSTLLGYDFAMVNGKFAAVSAPYYNSQVGSVHVFKYDLTSIYNGNSLFSGYVKAESVFIGASDGGSTDGTKRLLFGGTNGDNSYECSTLENRVYYNTGKSSELLLAKLPGNAGQEQNPDRVRLKAPGIIFDCPRGDRAFSESRYTETPVFVMNGYKCIGVGHSSVMDPKAQMDILGDSHATSKITVSSDRKMNWRAIRGHHSTDPTEKGGCYLFYNTRDENVIASGNVHSYNFHYIFSQWSNGVPHNVTYNSDVKGLSFTGSSTSNVTTNQYYYSTVNGPGTIERISFWVRCNNVSASYEQVLDFGGNIVSIKQDAIKLNVNATDYVSSSQTIVNDRWYHIFIDIYRGSVPNYSFTGYLDNIQILSQTLGTPLNNFSNRIIFGGGLNGYIGTPLFSAGETNQDRTELYNYGPPDEVFTVGGSAVVEGKLGVGVTNPTAPLEVNGFVKNKNPRFYAYNSSGGTTTSTGVLNVFNLTHVNTGNHYDTTLSRFTAPVDGVYEFKFAALHRYISSGGSNELTFAKNGTQATTRGVSYTYVTVTSDHDYNIAEIMLELQAGDYVEPYIHSVTSGTDVYYGGGLAHFSGKFLG